VISSFFVEGMEVSKKEASRTKLKAHLSKKKEALARKTAEEPSLERDPSRNSS
jgi:hypothetical protein